MRLQAKRVLGLKSSALTLAFGCVGLLLVMIVFRPGVNVSSADRRVVVAIYQGQGAGPAESLDRMFRRMNCTVTIASSHYINNNDLKGFDILCVPGGDMHEYSRELSPTGKENIRRFVRSGGAYIGVCGGAYFASERVIWQGTELQMTPLGLFAGTARGPINEIAPAWTPTSARVNLVDSTHPIAQNERKILLAYYNSGPTFLLDSHANVTVLGTYDKGGQPAVLAFDYGLGRVFLIGVHPEADSRGDGTNGSQRSDGYGSNWELMRKAVLWLRKEI